MSKLKKNFRRQFPNQSAELYSMVDSFLNGSIPYMRLEEFIKSLQSMRKLDVNTAKSMIRELREAGIDRELRQENQPTKYSRQIPEGHAEREMPSDYDEHALPPQIMSQLTSIAYEIIQKNKDAAPDKILSAFENNKQVKQWLKDGTINYGDLRDALDRVV